MKKLILIFLSIIFLTFYFLPNAFAEQTTVKCIYKNVDIEEKFKTNLSEEESAWVNILFPFDLNIDFLHKDRIKWEIKKIKTSLEDNPVLVPNKEELKKLQNMYFDYFRINPDFIYSGKGVRDSLTGEKLTNHVILNWVLDSGILFRIKFEYPNVINNKESKNNFHVIGTDGSVLLNMVGKCSNSNVSKEQSGTGSNHSNSIE